MDEIIHQMMYENVPEIKDSRQFYIPPAKLALQSRSLALQDDTSVSQIIGSGVMRAEVVNRISSRLRSSTYKSDMAQVGIRHQLRGDMQEGRNILGGLKEAVVLELVFSCCCAVADCCKWIQVFSL